MGLLKVGILGPDLPTFYVLALTGFEECELWPGYKSASLASALGYIIQHEQQFASNANVGDKLLRVHPPTETQIKSAERLLARSAEGFLVSESKPDRQ